MDITPHTLSSQISSTYTSDASFHSIRVIKVSTSLHFIISVAYFVLVVWSTWWVMGLFILFPIVGYVSAKNKLRTLIVGYIAITTGHIVLVFALMSTAFSECFRAGLCQTADLIAYTLTCLTVVLMMIAMWYATALHSLMTERDL